MSINLSNTNTNTNSNSNNNNVNTPGAAAPNNNGLYSIHNDSNPSLRYQNSLYSQNNGSNISIRRAQSPSKPQLATGMATRSNNLLISSKNQFNTPIQNNNNTSSSAASSSAATSTTQNGNNTVYTKQPLYMCKPFVKTALVKGSYKTIVQLPKYVDYHEWLALNVFESFQHLNKFYGVISEYVTQDKYPKMLADPKTEYIWVLPNNKSISLPANQYIDYALNWINNKIDDQTIFPTKASMTFPPSFLNDIKSICKQMFRIIAHIYYNQFDKIIHLSLEAHYNSFFAHFISFIREFDLIEKSELQPLNNLIESLEIQGKIVKIA